VSQVPRRADDRAASQLVIRAYETERARLARELHDGPVQILANAIFELQYCETLLERDPEQLRAALAHVQNDLKESLNELRRGVLDLKPSPLAELGLAPTLRHYGAEFERHFGIKTRVEVEALDDRPSGDVEVAVFRVVQEALHNIRKHARATRARIVARWKDDVLLVRVEDNGCGFTPTTTRRPLTFGLTTMRERAELIGASLSFRRRRGGGTVVELAIPRERLLPEAP